MDFLGVEIVCPQCRGELEQPCETLFTCAGCRREFPVVFGIPDLRVFPDPYIGLEEDRAKATLLAERFADLDFEGFVNFYYSQTSVVPPHHAKLYTQGLLAAPARAAAWLRGWEKASPGEPSALLDIGCGTAPLLLGATHYKIRAGVDIALRWLVVGKKRLAEAGLSLPLICACAEALPFPDGSFSHVVFDSTMEHVRQQRDSLADAHRALRPGGHLFLATPNRFSLGPDPQTGIWAGAWLPEKWTAALVRRAGGIPPVRKLLGAGSVKRLLREAGFDTIRVTLPELPLAGRKDLPLLVRWLGEVYNAVRQWLLVKQLLLLVGPLLHATARRAGDSAPGIRR